MSYLMESDTTNISKLLVLSIFSHLRAYYEREKITRIIHGDTNRRDKSRVKYFSFFLNGILKRRKVQEFRESSFFSTIFKNRQKMRTIGSTDKFASSWRSGVNKNQFGSVTLANLEFDQHNPDWLFSKVINQCGPT